MSLRWLVLATLASGCLHDELVLCGDELCPSGYGCDVERSICALPNGLSIPTKAAIDRAYCGQPSDGVLTIRNLSSNEIAYGPIISDIGVTVSPASGTFSPGDTDLRIIATVPVDSLPGQVIAGSLFLSLDEEVVRRPLKVTPIGAALGASTHSLSFGESAVATSTTKMVTYTNTGNVAVNLTAALQPPSAFAFTSTPTLHLEPGENQAIGVSFTSNSVQAYTSSLVVTPDAPLCQPPLDHIALDGAATTDAILLDSLTLDFADATCNQPADVLPLAIVNTNAGSQDVTIDIKGIDANLFTTDISAATIAGNGSLKPQITRVVVPFTTPGKKTATLGISASLNTAPLVTAKQVQLVQNVVAPSFELTRPCLDGGDLIPPHTSYMTAIGVTNTGNKTGAVTVSASPFPTMTISPSQFQIAPKQTINVNFMISNTSNSYMDITGLPIATIIGMNACSPNLPLIVCGIPQ